MLRDLSKIEIDRVAGGDSEDDIIVVTAQRRFDHTIYLDSFGNFAGEDFGADLLAGLGAGGYFSASSDEQREAIFKATVKALLPKGLPPLAKEAIATAITEVRNQLVDATSLESRAAAQQWFDNNIAALTEYFFNDYEGRPTGNNPIDQFRAIYGGEDPFWDWND